jgi:hypothetical protein
VPIPTGGHLPVTTTRPGHGMTLTPEAQMYREAPC